MNVSRIILLGTAVVLIVVGFFRWQEVDESPLIMTDGQGYYAYLPATFIYQDYSFGFVWGINDTYYPGETAAKYVNNTPYGPINKYFVGTALMQSPFFLLSHAYATFAGYKTDGYTTPYQIGVGVAGVFYACLGLWFLFGFLQRQGFSDLTASLTSVMVLFGSNLLFYAVYEPGMSHVYSFCTVSAILYFTTGYLDSKRTKSLLGASAALGLTALIRPTNAIVLFALPALTGSWSRFLIELKSLLANRKHVFLLVLVGFAIASIQPSIYFFQTGLPFVWPYGEEGFNFLKPEIANVLFSYRRGLFVYSPILLVALFGLILGIRKKPFRNVWLAIFLAVVTWIISSWWMWYYGGSFGHRAFVEYIPFLSLGLALFIQGSLGSRLKKVVLSLSIPICALTVFQTYQYQKQILPYDEINSKKYWELFLRSGDDMRWYHTPALGDGSYSALDSTVIAHNMENELGWGNEHLLTEESAFDGGKSSKMSGTDQYGITFRYNTSECDHQINTIRVSGQVSSNSQKSDLAYVCSIEDSAGVQKYWRSRLLRPQFPWFKSWGKTVALFTLPFSCAPSDRITIFPVKTDDATVFVDDMEISLIFVE